MAEVRVENVVASSSIAESLDLDKIAEAIESTEYAPERFPGLVYRLSEPKTSTLVFRSGKVVCTGGKCLEDVKGAISIITASIEKAGLEVIRDPEIEIQNIVATSDLGYQLNLNLIAISLSLERVEYEPEQFPGLVYRMDNPKVVLLVFGSGKVVCTGAKRFEDLETAVENLTRELAAVGALGRS